jgi:glycosyltransferase involved in cell wall biosynthesis
MNNADVTAYISTKDRYGTTLPLAMASIINQTVLPKKFIMFQDSEPVDIRTNSLYLHLLHLLDEKKIEWEIVFGPKKGQSWNHQAAITKAKTEWLWRLDDDNIAEPNVLEELLKSADDKTGAVAGLVIDPSQIKTTDDRNLKNDIAHIYDQPNTQWFKHVRKDVFDVEHLYSSFIYRKKASEHGYCLSLSPVCHREETIFSHEMFRAGWKLKINPNVITWHLREPTGGIRSYTDKSYWDHDEAIFTEKMKLWQTNIKDDNFYVILDAGLGDHWAFKHILQELKEKYKDKLVIACCYPAVFSNDNVKLISIQDAKNKFNNIEKYNLYQWMGENNWKGTLIDAYRKMYLS